jgi:luciferase family oxidoreductase group 1
MTGSAVHLSVLDQSPALQGLGHDVSIRQTIEMAEHCEALGYARFWMSEHHGSRGIVGSAPEILTAAIAARTHRIRVGTAGVLLPHYSPLKVAEQFRLLEAIAPGRIDLGVGRAPGTEGRMAYALNPAGDAAVERFPSNVRDLVAWTSGRPLVEGHPFAPLLVTPEVPTAPQVWVLGSSDYGAQVAAYLGLPYCFAAFIAEQGAGQALEIYRRYFQPSERWPKPHAAVCVFALAADSEAEARHIFATRARSRLDRDRGIRGPLMPPGEALAGPLTPAEQARVDALAQRAFLGDGPACAGRLRQFAAALDVDEIVVLTHTYDVADRKRSYELLAKEFGLGG